MFNLINTRTPIGFLFIYATLKDLTISLASIFSVMWELSQREECRVKRRADQDNKARWDKRMYESRVKGIKRKPFAFLAAVNIIQSNALFLSRHKRTYR